MSKNQKNLLQFLYPRSWLAVSTSVPIQNNYCKPIPYLFLFTCGSSQHSQFPPSNHHLFLPRGTFILCFTFPANGRSWQHTRAQPRMQPPKQLAEVCALLQICPRISQVTNAHQWQWDHAGRWPSYSSNIGQKKEEVPEQSAGRWKHNHYFHGKQLLAPFWMGAWDQLRRAEGLCKANRTSLFCTDAWVRLEITSWS